MAATSRAIAALGRTQALTWHFGINTSRHNPQRTSRFLASLPPHSEPSRQRMASTSSPPPKPKFSYHVAASFIGKDRPYDPSTHVFHFNPYNRIQPPRDNKKSSRPDSGHDAFFVSRVSDSGSVAFGVADGVGGWTESGVDPADFSHGLCHYSATAAYWHDLHNDAPLTARKLMQKGYESICSDGTVKAGGSTACFAIASSDGSLDLANLGDSGFLQLRLNGVHAYSEPQTHAFNTPFQLSLVPPSIAARMAAFGGAQLSDVPADADVTHHELRHGDVLVLATDGVLDNLFNQDILSIVSKAMGSSGAWETDKHGDMHVATALEELTQFPGGSSEERQGQEKAQDPAAHHPGKIITLQSMLATRIVRAAKRASVDVKRDGPFAKEVRRFYPQENWHGGKVDDICVVVVVVTEDGAGIRSKL